VTFDLSDEPELLEDTIERQVNSDGSMRQEDSLNVQNGVQNGNGHLENGHSENGQAARPLRTEWSVTRKLRVTQQGTYTSNYYINSEPCTLTATTWCCKGT
jgi:chromosome segregation protein